MKPRDFGYRASEIYKANGRQAARQYVKDNVKAEWRELVWAHVEIWRGKDEGRESTK